MKLKLLPFTVAIAVHISSTAEQVLFYKNSTDIALGGQLNITAGTRIDNKADAPLTPNNKKIGIDTSATVHASIKFPKFHGWNYGAQVGIKTTTVNADPVGDDFFERSYIYTENPNVGRIELGTNNGAANTMAVHGNSVAVAGGGIGGRSSHFMTLNGSGVNDGNFILSPGLAISDGNTEYGSNEKYRKITFYTPLMNGIKIGLSYAPDGANTGNKRVLPWAPSEPTSSKFIKDRARDIISIGVSWENKSDKEELKLAIVGEYAKYNLTYPGETSATFAAHPYQAVIVGGSYRYGKASIAVGYGNQFKSTFAKSVGPITDSDFYSVGIKYDFLNSAASLTYFVSSKNANVLNAISAGVEHNLAQGIVPYVEVSYFTAQQKRNYILAAPDEKTPGVIPPPKLELKSSRNQGTAFIVGTKILF